MTFPDYEQVWNDHYEKLVQTTADPKSTRKSKTVSVSPPIYRHRDTRRSQVVPSHHPYHNYHRHHRRNKSYQSHQHQHRHYQHSYNRHRHEEEQECVTPYRQEKSYFQQGHPSTPTVTHSPINGMDDILLRRTGKWTWTSIETSPMKVSSPCSTLGSPCDKMDQHEPNNNNNNSQSKSTKRRLTKATLDKNANISKHQKVILTASSSLSSDSGLIANTPSTTTTASSPLRIQQQDSWSVKLDLLADIVSTKQQHQPSSSLSTNNNNAHNDHDNLLKKRHQEQEQENDIEHVPSLVMTKETPSILPVPTKETDGKESFEQDDHHDHDQTAHRHNSPCHVSVHSPTTNPYQQKHSQPQKHYAKKVSPIAARHHHNRQRQQQQQHQNNKALVPASPHETTKKDEINKKSSSSSSSTTSSFPSPPISGGRAADFLPPTPTLKLPTTVPFSPMQKKSSTTSSSSSSTNKMNTSSETITDMNKHQHIFRTPETTNIVKKNNDSPKLDKTNANQALYQCQRLDERSNILHVQHQHQNGYRCENTSTTTTSVAMTQKYSTSIHQDHHYQQQQQQQQQPQNGYHHHHDYQGALDDINPNHTNSWNPPSVGIQPAWHLPTPPSFRPYPNGNVVGTGSGATPNTTNGARRMIWHPYSPNSTRDTAWKYSQSSTSSHVPPEEAMLPLSSSHDEERPTTTTKTTEQCIVSPNDDRKTHKTPTKSTKVVVPVATPTSLSSNDKEGYTHDENTPQANSTSKNNIKSENHDTLGEKDSKDTKEQEDRQREQQDEDHDDDDDDAENEEMIQWNAMLERLSQFKKKHGTIVLPTKTNRDPELGKWIQTQRRLKSTLSKHQKAELERVGFQWSTQVSWDEMFQRLVCYKQVHGDCLVPNRYNVDPKLGYWVSDQRKRKAKLAQSRIDRLESVGFKWRADKMRHAGNWHAMYEKLLAYKELNGDCRVPQFYPPEPKLRNWVDNQRKRKNKLTPERKGLLDKMDFPWSASERNAWEIMFKKLEQYKICHGDCRVPHKYNGDNKLSKWVKQQRKDRHEMPSGRQRRLDYIEFAWSVDDDDDNDDDASTSSGNTTTKDSTSMRRDQSETLVEHDHRQAQFGKGKRKRETPQSSQPMEQRRNDCRAQRKPHDQPFHQLCSYSIHHRSQEQEVQARQHQVYQSPHNKLTETLSSESSNTGTTTSTYTEDLHQNGHHYKSSGTPPTKNRQQDHYYQYPMSWYHGNYYYHHYRQASHPTYSVDMQPRYPYMDGNEK
mmetsp:Transcript_2229/g.3109  ORF Transcript_2229/g.3109 Transcript_2229/m.3109 type:complete len:1249 (+) Transcript_2229:135-3881(+)